MSILCYCADPQMSLLSQFHMRLVVWKSVKPKTFIKRHFTFAGPKINAVDAKRVAFFEDALH